jgi:hypothetical protein
LQASGRRRLTPYLPTKKVARPHGIDLRTVPDTNGSGRGLAERGDLFRPGAPGGDASALLITLLAAEVFS